RGGARQRGASRGALPWRTWDLGGARGCRSAAHRCRDPARRRTLRGGSRESAPRPIPHGDSVTDERSSRPSRVTRLAVPGGIAVGVVALIATGAAMFRHAGAQTNTVSLADAPKGVTVVPTREATYRATRRYVGTLEPWLSARVGPQIVDAYV